jgi:glycosyltransferase involved in cell wall biosynthesis
MISLILPYWNRQAAIERSLALMSEHYRDLQFEVIVVDDGSPEPFKAPQVQFILRVIRLPDKSEPRNPCVPYNIGASAASGDFIALSNPEILHETPVLSAMLSQLVELGPKGYVLAAAWCPDTQRWHCHSTHKRPDRGDVGSFLPAGADYHFLTLMHRALWDEIGGFDEDYREGAGYDDPDLVLRLKRAGAIFCLRDDLVVEHTRREARADWTPQMFERNRKLFFSKWAQS